MTERTPSRTAAGVAWLRAAHQIVDDEPRILDDPVAPRLLGPAGRRAIDERRAELFTPGALALRSHVLLRSRFTEDQLAAAAGWAVGTEPRLATPSQATTQYVILGAGLDTFAYRQPGWAAALRIFEVDQPASQQVKRQRLADAGIPEPENLTFVAIDFEAESLRDGLARAGADLDEPAFVSWLGVSMYLTRDAVDSVFRAVGAFPARSRLVFTFAQPRTAGTPSVADRAAEVGEPWQTFFTPDELERVLPDAGFSAVRLVTAQDAAGYFAGRRDALVAPRRVSIAVATV